MQRKILIAMAFVLVPHLALADDQKLEAALRRIEALENRMERMSALEAENRELRAKLRSPPKPLPSVRHEQQDVIATKPQSDAQTNWEGIYAGFNTGYGHSLVASRNSSTQAYSRDQNWLGQNPDPITVSSLRSNNIYGPVVGGQIGYNFRFAERYVAGLEADFDYADVSARSYSRIGITPSSISSFNSRAGLDWLGTAKVRLGYDLGKFLPFISGGLAFGQLSMTNDFYANNVLVVCCIDAPGSVSTVSVGWAAGAGAEYRVADNWSVKGEYLYTQLGSISGQGNMVGPSIFGIQYSSTGTTYGPVGVHQARVGVNYFTNWRFH